MPVDRHGDWESVLDPTRRQIVNVLLELGEASATTVADHVPVTRQAVMKHLGVLRRSGVVLERRRGREVRFRICPDVLDDAAQRLAGLAAEWERRLAMIAEESELRAQAAPREDDGL